MLHDRQRRRQQVVGDEGFEHSWRRGASSRTARRCGRGLRTASAIQPRGVRAAPFVDGTSSASASPVASAATGAAIRASAARSRIVGCFAGQRIRRIPGVAQRLEAHGAGVEHDQAADQALAEADDLADHFERRHRTDRRRRARRGCRPRRRPARCPAAAAPETGTDRSGSACRRRRARGRGSW